MSRKTQDSESAHSVQLRFSSGVFFRVWQWVAECVLVPTQCGLLESVQEAHLRSVPGLGSRDLAGSSAFILIHTYPAHLHTLPLVALVVEAGG